MSLKYFSLSLTLLILFQFSLVLGWYSKCDQAGRCYISETKNGEGIYLMPGYLPIFPDNTVIPTVSESAGNTSFSVDSLTGFSLYGPLSGDKGYECAGGLSECANSCCSDKGMCSDTLYSCGEKRDTKDLIYIITCSIFGGFVIFYWVTFFVLGCRYNKHTLKTQKEQQRYGDIVKNQRPKKNETIEENDEVDEPGMRTHGSVSIDSEKIEDVQVNEEEEKRRKMANVANKLNRLEQNQFEGNEISNKDEQPQQQPSVEPIPEKQNEGNLIDESSRDNKNNNNKIDNNNVEKIDNEFDEQNLEDM